MKKTSAFVLLLSILVLGSRPRVLAETISPLDPRRGRGLSGRERLFNPALAQVVKEFRQGGAVETTSLPSLDKSLLGCDWHPNIKGQELMAQTFEPYLRKLLGL